MYTKHCNAIGVITNIASPMHKISKQLTISRLIKAMFRWE